MSCLSGQLYTINSVKVHFPCKAYPSQLSMMDKILKGLDRSQNCLLESPTGSGKSLALLCSALAWQAAEHDKVKLEEKVKEECCCQASSVEVSDSMAPAAADPSVSVQSPHPDQSVTAVAVSDEHDDSDDDDFQVKMKKFRPSNDETLMTDGDAGDCQVMFSSVMESNHCSCSCAAAAAGKRRVPKIYFGTRTHKQIKQIVRELGKTFYSNTRMTILSSRENTCINPQVAVYPNKNEACADLLDTSSCSYYDRVRRQFTRSNMDLHGMPSTWDLEDIVSFGQQHKACPYFGVRDLRETADIVFCPYSYLVDPSIRQKMDITLTNQIVILDEAHNIEDSSREAASFSVSQADLLDAMHDLDTVAGFGVRPAEHRLLRGMCADLVQLIEQNKNALSAGYDSASKVWSGVEIVAQLELLGLTAGLFTELRNCYTSIQKEMEEQEQKWKMRRKSRKETEMKISSATNMLLGGLFVVLNFIYADNFKFVDDYRVAIVRTMTMANNKSADGRWLSKRRRNQQMTWSFVLHFWCMNPAVAFTALSHGVRSVILTSGTLAPMTSFASELGIPFPIQLEANHIIIPSQVWVGCISRGPHNNQLLGTYEHSETFAYQDEIGQVLLTICKTVPFGVLCFLPSYKALEKFTSRWQDTGLLDKVRAVKAIVTEPRASGKENFDDVMNEFYSVIKDCSASDREATVTGALFLAVCRGKVSEGLDFSDDNARAVVTVGIPYPNIKDTQVMLKKQYNDNHCSRKGLLCGRDWYEIQAYRAMNQALGRCIRHRRDWGALILIDERFAKFPQKYSSGLSKWVRQKVQYFSMFHNAHQSLEQFTHDRCSQPSADESSFVINDQNTSLMSLPGTPLKAIDNICSSVVAGDGMAHGLTFVHPRLSSTPAVHRTVVAEEHVAVTDVMSPSAGDCDEKRAVLRQDDKSTGCSQDGGFLLESQAVQRSVTVDEVNESQFKPAAVSTQISTASCARHHFFNLLPTISTFENSFASESVVSGMREIDGGKVAGADSETVSVTAEVCLNGEDKTVSKSRDSGVSRSLSPELFDGDHEVSQCQRGNKAAVCDADAASLSYSTLAQKLASRKLKTSDSSTVEKSEMSMVKVTCEAADRHHVKQTGLSVMSTHSRMSLRSSKRRQRGVDFLDEIDKELSWKKSVTVLCCPTCSCQIFTGADDVLVRETYEPYFWKTAFSSKMSSAHHEFTAVSVAVKYIDSLALITQPDSASSDSASSGNNIAMNSHWSEADCCCIQSVYCRQCSHSEHTSTWLGVQVKAVTTNCCPRLQQDQVWLVPHCVQSTTSS